MAKSGGVRPRRTGLPKLTEAQIQKQCVDFMALDGWRALKTDPCSDRGRAKGFGEEGMADHLFIRYAVEMSMRVGFKNDPDTNEVSWAQVLWVEFKRPGGYIAPHQALWHIAERARGALTACAISDFHPTFDGFVAWYRRSGLLIREGL